MRREIANSNERRRMQSINAGFQSLRSLLPHHEGEKLSKVIIMWLLLCMYLGCVLVQWQIIVKHVYSVIGREEKEMKLISPDTEGVLEASLGLSKNVYLFSLANFIYIQLTSFCALIFFTRFWKMTQRNERMIKAQWVPGSPIKACKLSNVIFSIRLGHCFNNQSKQFTKCYPMHDQVVHRYRFLLPTTIASYTSSKTCSYFYCTPDVHCIVCSAPFVISRPFSLCVISQHLFLSDVCKGKLRTLNSHLFEQLKRRSLNNLSPPLPFAAKAEKDNLILDFEKKGM